MRLMRVAELTGSETIQAAAKSTPRRPPVFGKHPDPPRKGTRRMPPLEKITCPHCWARFDTHSVLWISTHHSLYGDPRLGRSEHRRFLPTRFSADGFALDELGSACQRIACPSCHLEIPRVAAEMEQWIISVIGSPAAGKSFYLGALAHTLRRVLPKKFCVSITDTDPAFNAPISRYEQSMFGHETSAEPIRLGELIPKTQQAGEMYSRVTYDTTDVLLPRPFMFTLRPMPNHPRLQHPASGARLLCLYDNAGESYMAGSDSAASPVTRHLAYASLRLFLYDPTQDHDFRISFLQQGGALPDDGRAVLRQQHIFLTEAAGRARRHTNKPDEAKLDGPLIVVVTKQDLWGHLVPAALMNEPLILAKSDGTGLVNLARLRDLSAEIEKMLRAHSPLIVAAAEAFAHKQSILYVGVSSLGVKPFNDSSGKLVVRPCDIEPTGVEAPILYGLNMLLPGLFQPGRRVANQTGG